jgi:septum formation inhibitor-activating ATPase MinD
VNDGRYVVLGLGDPRAPWFSELAQWATAGVAPIEFVKCLSVAEVITRLESARPYSALLVDESATGLDLDLVDLARRHGCAVIAVDGGHRDWRALGVAGVLPSGFERGPLVAALADHASLVRNPRGEGSTAPDAVAVTPWRGQLVAVTGPGGTGASTAAMALAQGLADDVRYAGMLALADLSLNAELAMFHEVDDLVPALADLVDAHRHAQLGAAEVRSMTFEIVARRYRLLLGLHRHQDWTALTPRAVASALDSLRAAFHVTVADVDADVEGERETGSTDVEERNVLARTAVAQADVVVVVLQPDLKGVFAGQRTVHALQAIGVAAERTVAVVNRAPRAPRGRAQLAQAVSDLVGPLATTAPVWLPERRGFDDVHRNVERFPRALTDPLVTAVEAVAERAGAPEPSTVEPERIAPGSLGTWTDQEEAS